MPVIVNINARKSAPAGRFIPVEGALCVICGVVFACASERSVQALVLEDEHAICDVFTDAIVFAIEHPITFSGVRSRSSAITRISYFQYLQRVVV